MAIEFDCPHCQHHYRLKDELAGKTATCKNCRQKIVIPNPVTIPDDTPLPTPLDAEAAEAAALAALNEEAPKPEQEAAKIIDVECPHCNTKWTEPIERAGKNTICKNPECKARIKIPEPKDEGQYDWRQTRTKGPSLAKQNQEKLEGVVDAAADAKIVSGTALKEADATGEEIEPRPLKQKVMFVLLALGVLGGAAFGIRSCVVTRTENKDHRLMIEAHEEFAQGAEAYPKDELPQFTAALHLAAGEYALRHDTKEKLKEALDQFARAREALRAGNSPARNAMCADLAVALLVLGGTEEQAREQLRIRWTQETGAKYRPNERVFTVFEELRTTLQLLQAADPDFRAHVARRLTRELAKRGQVTVAVELIPLALFTPAELPEAKAIVALEVYRGDKASALPKTVADDLKTRGNDALKNAPSAQTLFTVLDIDKPVVFSPPGAAGAVTDPVRVAYTGVYMLKDKADEALKLALRPASTPDAQLRALTICADWAADPTQALDSALPIITTNANRKEVKLSPYFPLRLSQIAAAAGKHDLAKQFAAGISDESLRAWAAGDAVRARAVGAPKEKADDTWAEVPEDAKRLRAGHAWGRLWVARQNARLSGDRAAEVKAVAGWPAPVVPFGKAGVALGLQDK